MVLFGLVSSIFDFLAFGRRRSRPRFAGRVSDRWFIEFVITELVIALVVRTRHVGANFCW